MEELQGSREGDMGKGILDVVGERENVKLRADRGKKRGRRGEKGLERGKGRRKGRG
jgi:hypothetical protein